MAADVTVTPDERVREVETESGVGRFTPSAIARSKVGSVLRHAGPWLALAAALALPSVMSSPFRFQVLTIAFMNAAVAAGLVVSFGHAGMLNISQSTFVGVGAYTTAILMTEHGVPFLWTVLFAALLAGVAGIVLSLAALRVEGDYFALVSLAFSIAVAEMMGNWKSLTRGREGYFGIPPTRLFGYPIFAGVRAYYLALGVLIVAVLVATAITGSYAGRAMRTVRFDPIAAKASGISVPAVRLMALAVGSAIGGIAGSVQVATIRFISPSDFDLLTSFNVMVWVIIGGMTRMWSVVATAIAITYITEELRVYNEYRIGAMGLLILIAVFARGGVFKDWRRTAAERFRRA